MHVEKTFMTMHSQMCGKYVKKNIRMTEHLHKKHKMLLVPSQRPQDFQYILENPKPKLKTGF